MIKKGSIIVGFAPDNTLDIRDVGIVEDELQKFLPDCKGKHIFRHDWRNDSFVQIRTSSNSKSTFIFC